MRVSRSQIAFSLIEVVIALGVLAVALVGILGLLSNSLQVGRAAATDRLAVSMVNHILAELRSSRSLAPLDSNSYFDAEGTPVTNVSFAAYRIHVVGQVDTNYNDAAGRTNLSRFQLAIFPVSGPATNSVNQRIIHATVTR